MLLIFKTSLAKSIAKALNKKFVKQLEKASKVAKYALILGEDELAQNKVTVKNLETSEQKIVDRNSNYFI